MKKPEHIKEAKRIGDNSFALLNFENLPSNAGVASQVAALEADDLWQENHRNDISHQIDGLIRLIRGY